MKGTLGINSKRSWNPIRVFRQKKSKQGKENAKADPEHSMRTACEVVYTLETELETRVVQWIRDSKPPKHSKGKCKAILEETVENGNEHAPLIDSEREPKAMTSVLYHPDFKDWRAVNAVNQVDTQGIESSSLPSPFKVLDDAAASITDLIKIPFGERNFLNF
jgi:hypothetical protein